MVKHSFHSFISFSQSCMHAAPRTAAAVHSQALALGPQAAPPPRIAQQLELHAALHRTSSCSKDLRTAASSCTLLVLALHSAAHLPGVLLMIGKLLYDMLPPEQQPLSPRCEHAGPPPLCLSSWTVHSIYTRVLSKHAKIGTAALQLMQLTLLPGSLQCPPPAGLSQRLPGNRDSSCQRLHCGHLQLTGSADTSGRRERH